MRRHLTEDLSGDDLDIWADTIESREDIELESGYEELLSAFVFETADPSLSETLTDRSARRWLDRLSAPQKFDGNRYKLARMTTFPARPGLPSHNPG